MQVSVDQLPCYCFACTEDGLLQQVNEGLCRRLGYDRMELLGRNIEFLFTVSTRIFQQTHFGPMLRLRGQASEIFLTLKDNAGKAVPVLVNAARSNETDSSYTYVCIEVQNRQRFEEELIAARNAAEAALKDNTVLTTAKQELEHHLEMLEHQMHMVKRQNEELHQFNKVITHDLQEPLRKLSIFANMLLRPEAVQEKEEYISKLNKALVQMRQVISGLQQYVWLTERPLEPEIIELYSQLLEIQEQLREQHPNIQLHIETGMLEPIRADKAQINVLLLELLSNAIRFRRQADRVTVRVNCFQIRRNRYQNIAGRYQYQNYNRLELQDDGLGFNNEYREKVFGLFQRLHSESGRGIGLALCKKIIEAHHGFIHLNSQLGVGTLVSIFLPSEPAIATGAVPEMNENLKL